MASYIFIYSLFFFCFASVQFLCQIEAAAGGIIIDLIHRDSPLSPSYDPSRTLFERLRSSFERSFSRKSSLMLSSLARTTSNPHKDLEAPVSPKEGEYLMKIGIGTPPVETLGIADTGSDLTWTQCKPCTSCYKQKSPLFDPKKTNTYRTVPCKSQLCNAVGLLSCGKSNVCEYQNSYGDSSYTFGDLSLETITFGSGVSFPRVVFGCGHENGGTFSDAGSGIIGLGRGPLSIIKQIHTIGGKFSYCLTLLNSNATSKIKLGPDATVSGPNVVSTPLVDKDPDTFYYLTLKGVSVGSNRIDYNGKKPYSNEAATVEEGNIIIDSGTTLTFLPSELYEGLESAIILAVKGKSVSGSVGSFNVCYEKSDDFSAPPLIIHFDGGDVELPQESTFVEVEQGVVCLTVVPSDNRAIFGNLHQMNYEIGYDIVGKKVSFLKTDCSKSQ